MPILANGSSVTIAVAAGQVLTVQSDQATYDFENPVGTRVGEYAYDNVFGPFTAAGSIKLTSVQGTVFYEIGSAASVTTSYVPSTVAITGGTIGGRSVSDVASAARLSLSNYGASNPLYIAHRGSDALYPEESAVAYARAFADGELCLETDVQTLSDGGLGLMHDGTVDRTTTGTGAVNTFTTSAFKALTMDSSVWLGSNYGDTLNPMLFQELIDTYKGKAILCPEDKDFVSMTALVRALINSGVPFDQALVQCFTAANLTTPVNAGYQAIGLAGSNSPTAATIAATGAKWAGVDSLSTVSTYVAAGLKTLVYTVNRRWQRDQYLAQGASGFISDDPTYLRSAVALSTTDYFSRQTWAPGMLGSNADLNLSARGVFSSPNYWGYNVTTAGFLGCLQGYLCPVANPSSFTLTFQLTFDAFNVGTSFINFAIGTTDQPFTNAADQFAGYDIRFFPTSGNINVFRKDAGSLHTQIGSSTSSGPTIGTEYTYQLTVTPTSITFARTTGGAPFSFTVNDTTYRGGYIQLGRDGIACRFRTLTIS